MIDLSFMGISPEMQAFALQVVMVLTLALPALEKIAEMTHTKWDNQAVAALRKLLSFVPRVRLGK